MRKHKQKRNRNSKKRGLKIIKTRTIKQQILHYVQFEHTYNEEENE